MHDCWNVAENTLMIFHQLGGHKKLSALNSLARTCRMFSEPALDLLWETQKDILPLLQCLPPHIWTNYDSNFTLLSPIRAKAWDRVLIYSPRVKKLRFKEDAVSLDVMRAIIACFPTHSLLPNIRSLNWQAGPTLFHFLRFFAGPQLKTISLDLEGPVTHLSALHYLASASPLLTDVSFGEYYEGDVPSEVVTDLISSFVVQLHHLQRLNLDALDGSACRYLAGLRGLQSLNIGRVEERLFPEGPRTHPSFSDLRELILTGPLTNITNLVAALRDSPLMTIRFTIYEGATEDQTQRLFLALARNCSTAYLETIGIRFEGDPNLAKIMTATSLEPLLRFPNLTNVNVGIKPPGWFQLDDTFITAMAIAWPQIVTLSRGNQY
ncbi:hypothetical protein C8R43DRAFT_1128150 [Mycena crocata]|nr:hypothetical protein C8R43DRAFT_1128150 [Mycena crocata]